MDLAQIVNLGFVGLASYGTVAAIGYWKPGLPAQHKFVLLVVIAFAFSFVPNEVGNYLLEHAKEAISVAVAVTGGNVILNKVSK